MVDKKKTYKYPEYHKQRYLDKVKREYRYKIATFMIQFHKKTGRAIDNEIEIFEMIYDAKNTKEVKNIYDNIMQIIELSE